MSVRAKFKVESVFDNGFNKKVTFGAVYGNSGENADYSKSTPVGKIEITIDNSTKADEEFKPLAEFYLTFEKVAN